MKNLHKKVHFACLFQKFKQSLALFILLFTISSQATTTNFQISLDSKNITVESLIDQIESNTQYRFVYKTANVDLERTVNVKGTNKPINELLEEIFENTYTGFEIIGEQIFLKKSEPVQGSQSQSVGAQSSSEVPQKIVKGLITDEVDQPFPGVTVMIIGTS